MIRDRIATINESLVGVDYNPGRYIKLEAQPTPHTDVREFRADLRACTEGAVSAEASDQYSEQKFLQVSRLIERFRGREGQTDTDRKWTRFVTDVRNWFIFTASERYREDDTEYEHYADSAGKSGGQKEKLAYTILAASLAYQFKLEWGAVKSRTFRFAVIDEAFGRGSDESTRFALQLFARLGLQLLIVTPLQKIHVIEPYVSAGRLRGQPDELLLPAADADDRGVPRPAASARDRPANDRRRRPGHPDAGRCRRRRLTCRVVDPSRRSTRVACQEMAVRRVAHRVRRGKGLGTAGCPAARPRGRGDRGAARRGTGVGGRVGPGRPRPAARGVQEGRRPPGGLQHDPRPGLDRRLRPRVGTARRARRSAPFQLAGARDGRKLSPACPVGDAPPDAAAPAGGPVGQAAGHRPVDR